MLSSRKYVYMFYIFYKHKLKIKLSDSVFSKQKDLSDNQVVPSNNNSVHEANITPLI